MNHYLILTISLILALAHSQSVRAEDSPFRPLQSAPEANDEQFFAVAKGEAKIEGQVIKLMVVKPEHITVSYKNESDKDVFPKYTVRVYNRYGYLLGSDKVGISLFGGSSKLEPGDVGGEKLKLDLVDIKGVFKHARLELPDDFFSPAWVSLSASNTKIVGQDGARQPATAPESKSEANEKPKPESEGRSQ